MRTRPTRSVKNSRPSGANARLQGTSRFVSRTCTPMRTPSAVVIVSETGTLAHGSPLGDGEGAGFRGSHACCCGIQACAMTNAAIANADLGWNTRALRSDSSPAKGGESSAARAVRQLAFARGCFTPSRGDVDLGEQDHASDEEGKQRQNPGSR